MIVSDLSTISIARSTEADPEFASDSFLSILDDKNKVIESLKTQLKNQKMQILYYMRKDISNSKLVTLSETCTTQRIEENIPVILAMDSYKRKNGFKSNMFHLYDHMRHLDEKLIFALKGQEFVLRKVMGKLCKFLKQYKSGNIKLKIEVGDVCCVDLFQKLTEATVSLRKKLEAFRLSCNRLILIEDERNSIAEQVLTLPVEQRLNYNFLVGIRMQNSKLEKQVKSIEQNQETQKREVNEISAIEKKLSMLQQQINSSFIENDELPGIEEMLKKLGVDANNLLGMTSKFKEKYRTELSNMRNTNVSFLNEILYFIKSAIEDETFDETKLFSAREQPAIFGRIRTEINEAKSKISKELDRTKSENEALKTKLNKALLDKNEVKFAYNQLQKDFQSLKTAYSEQISNLKLQRDNYRYQVEKSEMIRETYMKIAEEPSSTVNSNELHTRNLRLEKRVKLMKNIIEKQSKEIALQGDFIENLKGHNNKRAWRKNYILKTSQMSNSINNSVGYSSERNTDDSNENSDAILVTQETYNWTDPNISTRLDKRSVGNVENTSSMSCYQFHSKNEQIMKEIVKAVLNEEETIGQMSVTSFALQMNRRCLGKETEENWQKDDVDKELERSSRAEIEGFCQPVEKCSRNYSGGIDQSGDSKQITVLAFGNNRMSSSSDENWNLNL